MSTDVDARVSVLTWVCPTSETVEAQLLELAACTGPLRRVMAAVAARLAETEGYARLSYARLGDYALERMGVSSRQVQELVRVHHKLGELPALERALLTNALAWSKVRLVARVASLEDVEDWIARARRVTTRQLEALVREARGGEAERPGDEDDEPTCELRSRCSQAVREKWALVHEVAERVAGQRLRSCDALEWVVAEACSALAVDPVAGEAELPRTRQGGLPSEPAPRSDRAPARALPRPVAELAEGLGEADAFELDRRLRTAIRLEQTLDAGMAPLLRVVGCAEYAWSDTWRPLASFARDELGMSATKARVLLRIERLAGVCPELRRAYRGGRLSWAKVRCLLPLLALQIEGEWRPAWVAWAQRVTVRRLEADVARALLLRGSHPRAFRRCLEHPERAQDPLPEDEQHMCAPDDGALETESLRWRAPRGVVLLFLAVRRALRRRKPAASDGELLESMLDHALLTWTCRDPQARRPSPVFPREGWRCAVPGCTSRRNLHDHHIVFRSAQGGDFLRNRMALCAFHHERSLHKLRHLRIVGEAPHGLVFELGVRADHPPLARYRSGDVLMTA